MESRTKTEDPPLTDLDHYARPENYTGSNISTLTRFLIAKEQEEPKARSSTKKKKIDSEERKLFKRYRHILSPGYGKKSSSTTSSESSSSDSGESDEENQNIPSKHKSSDSSKSKFHKQSTFKEVSFQNSTKVKLKNRTNLENYIDDKEEDAEDDEEWSHSQTQTPTKKLSSSSTDSGIRTMDEYIQSQQDSGDADILPTKSRTRNSLPNFESTSMLLESRTSLGNVTGLARKMGLVKMMTVKNKLAQLSKTARRRMQFRRITVGIVNVLKLAKAIIKPTDSPNALLMSFTALSTAQEEPVEDSENMRSYGLHFDPSYFKANKEISVSNGVKSILSLPPNRRTSDQIQTAIFGLQSLSSFAEYPLHIQEKLARVAWFEIVTPMRTIIRQGHFAENFYFILSGKALVTLHKQGEAGMKTAGMMKKGTSFGELALLHHSRRTATVTSHDTVQLLSIGREDFFDIFMARHGTSDMPEHIKFVTQLDFMKDWPVERLLERPDQCLQLFFKRNTVIQKDSKKSDWFYIIKSGSCQVLKELKGVTARGPHEKHTDGPMFSCHFKQQRNPNKTDNDKETQPDNNEDDRKTINPNKSFQGKAFSKLQYSNGLKTAKPHFVSNRPRASSDPKPVQADSVFIQMGVLKPKDVFGLDCVNFDSTEENTSSSVILVSLGAECIMLSKSFYMKNANDRVKKNLSEIVSPYPDEGSMQQSLQNKADWEFYKQSLMTRMSVEKPTGLRSQPLS